MDDPTNPGQAPGDWPGVPAGHEEAERGGGAPPSGPYPPYPPYPSYPTNPGPPSVPLSPGYPGGATEAPAYPPYPPYAPYPPYPVPPSVPLAGSSGPVYPGYPYSPPPALAVAAAPAQPAAESWRPEVLLRGPLPLGLVLILSLLGLIALAVAAALGVALDTGDWASGAIAGGIAAYAQAGLVLVGLALRLALGVRAPRLFLVGLAALVILGALGGVGTAALPPTLHRAQARSFEDHADWVNAIAEYQQAGERPPGSHDLARVYVEWGDEDAQAGRYADAIGHYDTVTDTYPAARPEVARAHAAAAKVYYALGQQQLAGGATCGETLASFQTLAGAYGDTPEGAKARAALAKPVAVTGQIVNYPAAASPILALSRSLTGSIGTMIDHHATQSQFSQDYTTTPDSQGGFTFPAVVQGNYNMALLYPDGSYHWWFHINPYNPYSVVVGPICTLHLTTYDAFDGF